MNYCFVFQNKTYDEEYKGGYLWAPQSGPDGRRVSHWNKMKSVKQGDIIIHSYKKKIKAISIAKADVYASQRPTELSDEWQKEGWRVDCEYITFDDTIVTSDYKDKLLELQPITDAPFNCKGRGNTGYLFDSNRRMFEFIIEKIALSQKNNEDKKRVYGLLNVDFDEQETLSKLEIEMKIEDVKAKQLSLATLAMQVNHKQSIAKSQKKESIVYHRDPYLKEMVKRIAEGKCQYCGNDAPFLDKSNTPYLEEHHVKRLADGGSDTMDNVVAICPNCHCKMHVLNEIKDQEFLLEVAKQNDDKFKRILAYQEKVGLN